MGEAGRRPCRPFLSARGPNLEAVAALGEQRRTLTVKGAGVSPEAKWWREPVPAAASLETPMLAAAEARERATRVLGCGHAGWPVLVPP